MFKMEYSLFVILGGVFSLLLLLTSFMKWDLWPFSHYPMFSKYQSADTVGILRLALVRKDGQKYWWKPAYQHLQRDYAAEFLQVIKGDRDQKSRMDACRFVIGQDKHQAEGIESIAIYNRIIDLKNASSVKDEIVLVVPVEETLSQFNAK